MQKTRILSIRTIVLLIASVLAVTLCLTGTARAALSIFSPDYQAEFQTSELEVGLTENGTLVPDNGALLGWMDGMTITPGKTYDEVLAAKNIGDYDQYVRVVVKKYWTDADDNRVSVDDEGNEYAINPAFIHLEETGDWIKDEDNTTDGQIVLYSTKMLAPGESCEFIKTLTIDPAVLTDKEARKVADKTITNEDGTSKTIYTTTYLLDGFRFNIEAEVDAVQTHNAPDAIKGVWGYSVSADQLS